MSFVTRRKSMEPPAQDGHSLVPTLGWPHLVALGVGAIIGTGIYTLTGVAAGLAGPAVMPRSAAAWPAPCAWTASAEPLPSPGPAPRVMPADAGHPACRRGGHGSGRRPGGRCA